MQKEMYFNSVVADHWPEPEVLKRYFIAPQGKEWFYAGGNDSASFHARGLYGTAALTPRTGRVDVTLYLVGHAKHGILLSYSRWDGRTQKKETYISKGDLNRLDEKVFSLHGDRHPIGLYIPFKQAWLAVRDFIESGGELPSCIDWIADTDLPPNAYPAP